MTGKQRPGSDEELVFTLSSYILKRQVHKMCSLLSRSEEMDDVVILQQILNILIM